LLWGRACCAIAGEASNAAIPATVKIAFMAIFLSEQVVEAAFYPHHAR
jgi:hypothetical protein